MFGIAGTAELSTFCPGTGTWNRLQDGTLTIVARRHLRKDSQKPFARLGILSGNTDKTCMQNGRDRDACWQKLFREHRYMSRQEALL